MRPIHLTDLDAAVRALLAQPEADWRAAADALVENARIADRFRKRLRKAHPEFGVGSLSSSVSRHVKAPVKSCDANYRRCLFVLLRALE